MAKYTTTFMNDSRSLKYKPNLNALPGNGLPREEYYFTNILSPIT